MCVAVIVVPSYRVNMGLYINQKTHVYFVNIYMYMCMSVFDICVAIHRVGAALDLDR